MKYFIYYIIALHAILNLAQCHYEKSSTSLEEEKSQLEPPMETFQSSSNVAGGEEDLAHECLRDCSKDTHCKKCYYKFKAEWYISMSKACYDCPYNLTDCFRPHCVVLDGRERPIVTINRRFPGPSIQVCEGDEVIVDLENDLLTESTTIHWHGIHQVGTPYMDGVQFLTQCPIDAGTWFRYHFIASPAGTHFWHSHIGFQRDDGIFGSLIVRSRKDSHAELYDVDDPKHVMVLMDWFDKLIIEKFQIFHLGGFHNTPYNILVNGLGKYLPLQNGTNSAYTPLYEFQVKAGLRYRFRSISNAVQDCPIEISVDNHKLLVIASDGENIEPVEVDSLVIYEGERWDFVINANQLPGVYWVKYRGLLDCVDEHSAAYQVAVLRYDDANGFPNEPKDINYNSTIREGVQLNKLNDAPGDLKTFYTVADTRSHKIIEYPSPFARTPDHKFFLEFDFYAQKNDWFRRKDFYPNGAPEELIIGGPQINFIAHKAPNVPPLSQPDEVDQTMICNGTSRNDCKEEFCLCTHVINVELGSLVEVILLDTGSGFASHSFHLHGYSFAVLGMERLGEETTLKDVKYRDKKGKLLRNLDNPPLKDTVPVPDGGYTIVRFIADNPGYWLLHCHISFHNELGMGLVFKVGERKHLPPVPSAFPKCGSWVPKPVDDLQAKINRWKKYSKKL